MEPPARSRTHRSTTRSAPSPAPASPTAPPPDPAPTPTTATCDNTCQYANYLKTGEILTDTAASDKPTTFSDTIPDGKGGETILVISPAGIVISSDTGTERSGNLSGSPTSETFEAVKQLVRTGNGAEAIATVVNGPAINNAIQDSAAVVDALLDESSPRATSDSATIFMASTSGGGGTDNYAACAAELGQLGTPPASTQVLRCNTLKPVVQTIPTFNKNEVVAAIEAVWTAYQESTLAVHTAGTCGEVDADVVIGHLNVSGCLGLADGRETFVSTTFGVGAGIGAAATVTGGYFVSNAMTASQLAGYSACKGFEATYVVGGKASVCLGLGGTSLQPSADGLVGPPAPLSGIYTVYLGTTAGFSLTGNAGFYYTATLSLWPARVTL